MNGEQLEEKLESESNHTHSVDSLVHCDHSYDPLSFYDKTMNIVYGSYRNGIQHYSEDIKKARYHAAPLITAIYAYRITAYPVYNLSKKLFGRSPAGCKFEPSCSQYMLEAVQKKGLFKGFFKGVWRILRCNPFSAGGKDPVD